MNVFLNNSPYSLEKENNLFEFLEKIKIGSTKGIAIAVNDTVIPKSEWDKIYLTDNDKITLIKATAGG